MLCPKAINKLDGEGGNPCAWSEFHASALVTKIEAQSFTVFPLKQLNCTQILSKLEAQNLKAWRSKLQALEAQSSKHLKETMLLQPVPFQPQVSKNHNSLYWMVQELNLGCVNMLSCNTSRSQTIKAELEPKKAITKDWMVFCLLDYLVLYSLFDCIPPMILIRGCSPHTVSSLGSLRCTLHWAKLNPVFFSSLTEYRGDTVNPANYAVRRISSLSG